MNTLKVFLLLSMVVGNVFCDGQIHSGYWDEESVAELVKSGGDFNQRDADNNTPLIAMAAQGNKGLVNQLIKAGVDVNAKNQYGSTALYRAAYANDLKITGNYEEIVSDLLAAEADANISHENGDSPLHVATREAISKELLMAGANVNVQNDMGDTPLSNIVDGSFPDIKVVKGLLEAGADPNIACERSFVPLHWAAESGRGDVVKILLDHGAKLEARGGDGQTALMFAAEVGSEEAVDVLLVAGADVNAKDHGGASSLFFAINSANASVVKKLLDAGADSKFVNSEEIVSPEGQTLLVSLKKFIEQSDTPGAYTEIYKLLEVATKLQ